jgi:hypothetical protein
MKRLIIVAVAVSVAVVVIAVSASESRAGIPPDPIIGAWESFDVDGSYQRLMIGGGPGPSMSFPPDPYRLRYHIVYFDRSSTTCEGAAIAMGMGTSPDPYAPNTLEAELSGWCLTTRSAFDGQTLVLTYSPDGDVLVQETGGEPIIWQRPRMKVRNGPTPTPTITPAPTPPTPTATPTPTPGW